MYLEQLADSTEELTLKIPHLVCENLERASETTAAVAVTSAVWEGKGMHSSHFVNWSTITRTYSLPSAARGKDPKKSRCTLSIRAPAWYLNISTQA